MLTTKQKVLRRFWYAVMPIEDLTDGPKPFRLLEENIVLFLDAGDIETSLMLHFRPDLVRMARAANFAPATIEIAREFDLLRPTGFTAFGWIAQDLHPAGAAGDASRASAEKGRLTAEFQVDAFIKLLRDMTRFSLERLA
jgi:creatinine amidohydrolase